MNNIIRYKGNENKIVKEGKYAPQIKELNTDPLVVNKVYTYKQLCELLHLPIKSSNSKNRQLLELSRFFEYEKTGSKFKITNIYTTPIPYVPIITSSSKYNSDMINVILSYLYSTGKEVMYLTQMDFVLICGLANELYKKYGSEYSKLAREYNITLQEVSDFYSTSYHLFRGIIYNALSSMESRCILKYVNTYVITERINIDGDTVLREATEDEVKKLLELQYNTLQELQLTSLNELWYRPQQRKEYNEELKKRVLETFPYWEYFYKTIKIISPANIVRQEVDSELIRRNLNLKVFNVLHDKTIKHFGEMFAAAPDGAELWLETQSKLEDTLIKLMGNTQ